MIRQLSHILGLKRLNLVTPQRRYHQIDAMETSDLQRLSINQVRALMTSQIYPASKHV